MSIGSVLHTLLLSLALSLHGLHVAVGFQCELRLMQLTYIKIISIPRKSREGICLAERLTLKLFRRLICGLIEGKVRLTIIICIGGSVAFLLVVGPSHAILHSLRPLLNGLCKHQVYPRVVLEVVVWSAGLWRYQSMTPVTSSTSCALISSCSCF